MDVDKILERFAFPAKVIFRIAFPGIPVPPDLQLKRWLFYLEEEGFVVFDVPTAFWKFTAGGISAVREKHYIRRLGQGSGNWPT